MAEPTENKTTLKATGACVSRSPQKVQVLKGQTKEILIASHPASDQKITVKFNKADAEALFSKFPKTKFELAPGESQTFVIRTESMGIKKRPADKNFTDDKESFARTFEFTHEPGRCGGGHHAAWHIEC